MLMKKVLIATDFSPAAQKLFNCIEELKNMGLEEAVIVHVVDIRIGEGSTSALQSNGEERLNEIVTKLEGYGIHTKTYTPIGFAATEIVQIAKAEEVSLILIGSRGKSAIKEIFLGSTTFDVIRLTDVPVLVEKYKKEKEEIENVCINKFQKILLPIDFSDCSSLITQKIMTLPPGVEEVILLSVVDHGESNDELERKKIQYKERLQKIADEFTINGINSRIEVVDGIPSKVITEVADRELVTAIAMGTRGRGLIKALLLGSTSDAVARISSRPVLLIPCNK
ncbi:universal stress protein [Alkaliphilus peptidifermentans]|uniref:Nucleotide-binding universal stress protein, UspA family n=1 Tax=Alkaliphilus peptidifermentans DSM 18978 TaxID=1120976 RepID=A0A1G5LGU6_9FIRM|nr:universal stress protein [Alkaliphilus peptidifermentans]SCZ12062.1 Nucleotide-binding universal stress protein, UspA family [Alkaliphilus peptidifermentans DSM 18978]